MGGFSDDNIVLMLADDIPYNARNPFKNTIYGSYAQGGKGDNLFQVDDDKKGGGVEVDYRGTDVTIDAFRRALLGRHLPGESSSRKLDILSPNTNLLIFMTGHGGDQFFKFQDGEEITTHDLQSLFYHMKKLSRFQEALVIMDTCQAFSMADGIDIENVRVVGSSLKGENSYSHHNDAEIGLSVIDRFTHNFMEYLDKRKRQWDAKRASLSSKQKKRETKYHQNVLDTISIKEAVVDSMSRSNLGSNVGLKDNNCIRSSKDVPLSDFFAMKGTSRGKGGDSLDLLTDKSNFLGLEARQVTSSFSSQVCGSDKKEQLQTSVTMTRNNVDADDNQGGNVGGDGIGMKPSDPIFLLYLVVLGILVISSSKMK